MTDREKCPTCGAPAWSEDANADGDAHEWHYDPPVGPVSPVRDPAPPDPWKRAALKCVVPMEALHADNLAGSQLIAPSLREHIADAVVALREAASSSGVRDPSPPENNFAALREAAVFANRQIDAIRLRVLDKYPSGRLDLCPLESRCYEVRLLMSAVITATEDLRRETGMYDGRANVMPAPAETEGRGVRGAGVVPPEPT